MQTILDFFKSLRCAFGGHVVPDSFIRPGWHWRSTFRTSYVCFRCGQIQEWQDDGGEPFSRADGREMRPIGDSVFDLPGDTPIVDCPGCKRMTGDRELKCSKCRGLGSVYLLPKK